ncbi:MAG: hypothetical protein K9G76_02350 [Bacteroidales bacterium]|nr:hypothetical protein [Bacteroidales bacterium]MCF8404891.1 hypothetical protein [Bacteroidales bacterium]
MKKNFLLILAAILVFNLAQAQFDVKKEALGIDQDVPVLEEYIPPQSTLKNLDAIPPGGLLLIPESYNDVVMAFDPITGDLIDPAFIVDDATDFFTTPIQAIQSPNKDRIYVSDQVKDVIQEFDNAGNFLGTFAPAGGPNTAYADNIRGMCYRNGTDHILVSDGNNDAVQEFDASGNYVGTFGPAGRMDPFDIMYWAANDEYLVCDIDGGGDADSLMKQSNTGTVLGDFANGMDFPEQVCVLSNGNILVAGFSPPSGIYEYLPNGTQVGYYDVVTGCRGIYELGNGNWLVTAGTSVHEIDNTNTLISTKYSAASHSFRLISLVEAPVTTVDVTLRVDMQEQTVPPEGVHVAGSFPAPYPFWDPAGIALNPPALGSVYTITLQLEPGTALEFKYVNGDAWGMDESVPASCAQNGNRYLTVPDNDTILPVVCFGKCVPCVVPQKDITFQVDMSNETVSTNGVHIAGSFQGWDPTGTPMIDQGGGIYAVTLTLGQGEYHEYKFLNGNAWGTDESVPPACATNNNRSYTVPATNDIVPLVCFGSCDPCTSVTDINVTFKVDMSEQTVAPEGVHIAGSFQGWDPAGTLMTDMGSGIWEASFVLQSGAYHEYKFVNGIAWGQDEIVPWYCNQNNNRYLTVPNNDTILPAVCFSSCLVCNPPQVNVLFQVDMSLQQISPDGVHLAGSFQGWDPAATLMTDAGNNIYQVSLSLGEGEFHEYKFINGNTFDGAEVVPGECAGLGGNREFFVSPSVTTLDLVCFGECAPCEIPSYLFDLKVNLEGPYNGTDMNTYLETESLLPNSQPYNGLPWDYNGSENIVFSPVLNVVDWLLLELRSTDGDASTATADKMFHREAVLLLSDGSIVNTADNQPEYNLPIFDNLYVVLWHRNHLAIMTSEPLVPSGDIYTYDFTSSPTSAYEMGQIDLGGGVYGMIGGDSDGNGIIDTNDKDVNWMMDAGLQGYFGSDLNLDSQVNNIDKADIWNKNNGEATPIP